MNNTSSYDKYSPVGDLERARTVDRPVSSKKSKKDTKINHEPKRCGMNFSHRLIESNAHLFGGEIETFDLFTNSLEILPIFQWSF